MASAVGTAFLRNPNLSKLLHVAEPSTTILRENYTTPTILTRPSRKVYGAVRAKLSDAPTKESAAVPAQTSQNGPTKPNPWNEGSGSLKSFALQAKMIIRRKKHPSSDEQWVDRMDVVGDMLGQKILLQLVSNEIDPATQIGKRSQTAPIEDWAAHSFIVADIVQYTADFYLDSSFGVPGALIITNHHQNEFFVESVSLTGHPSGPIYFPTHSWMHSEKASGNSRVFFSNQVYLPSATPPGLQDIRGEELNAYRGDGKGVRQEWENVYDYDVYNDLGDADQDKNLTRPVLGGSKQFPYPRRNRTGRGKAKTDPIYESRLPGKTVIPYVPRDEKFEEIKQQSYLYGQIRGLVQGSVPDILDHFRGSPKEFDSFVEIDRLYTEGIKLLKQFNNLQGFIGTLQDLPLPDVARAFVGAFSDQTISILKYPLPQLLAVDRFSWLRDGEFARQFLAGLNPCIIERLKVFPPVSSLDNPELYGPKESAIQAIHIQDQLEKGLTIDKALSQGKLFIVDYHDIYIPFINDINAAGGRQSYASRTLFFLQKEGTLKPLAIELTLPPPHQSSRVLTPSSNATEAWFWTMAKAHVSCNDAGYHQLISHWLRTHACTEPYIISTNRQLSPLHPIYKLLHPHFRYTLEINAAARQSLIPADGVIEKAFQPGKYAMQMSSVVYGKKWRFDTEGLPQELMERGVAEEDPTSSTGVRLLIGDYPFAQDGLLIWSAIKSWVEEYVKIYYKDPKNVQQDQELQKWWEEIRVKGHPDKKDEEWWPQLQSEQDLSQILTTMIWITSGLHAAVNFGQFAYAGFMPNKPTLMRKLIPLPNTQEYEDFLRNPQAYFLSSLPSQAQSTVLMAVVEALSTHSPDEEYLSSERQPHWFGSKEVTHAFKKFQEELKGIEIEIQHRNADPSLKNRNGAGVIPYELLMPTSPAGITGRGIPNSISI